MGGHNKIVEEKGWGEASQQEKGRHSHLAEKGGMSLSIFATWHKKRTLTDTQIPCSVRTVTWSLRALQSIFFTYLLALNFFDVTLLQRSVPPTWLRSVAEPEMLKGAKGSVVY